MRLAQRAGYLAMWAMLLCDASIAPCNYEYTSMNGEIQQLIVDGMVKIEK